MDRTSPPTQLLGVRGFLAWQSQRKQQQNQPVELGKNEEASRWILRQLIEDHWNRAVEHIAETTAARSSA